MTSSLLQGIANPQIADIGGRFRAGTERRETRETEEETNRIASEIVRNQIGFKFGELAFKGKTPMGAVKLAQALGIPTNDKDRILNAAGTIKYASDLLQGGNDPKAVGQLMAEQAQQLARSGIDITQMTELAGDLMSGDPQRIQAQSDALLQLSNSLGAEEEDGKFSAKTEVLSDGSTIQSDTKGNIIVRDPTGKVVTGKDAAAVTLAAREEGIRVQSARAGGRTSATKEEQRASDLIGRGEAAAESTATIRRALSLMDLVKTGGVSAISLAVKQKLGIEGADEGELSNSLGKSVLSQLRETFGAAFTESEGDKLDRIEAGFGKSVAANRRLLGQALRIAERTANRAIKAARARGQDDVADDLEDLLSFSLELEDQQPEATASSGVDLSTLSDEELLQLRQRAQ